MKEELNKLLTTNDSTERQRLMDKLRKYLKHSMASIDPRGFQDLSRIMVNPICPKCERITLRDKKNTMTCPHCGHNRDRSDSTPLKKYLKEELLRR